MLSRIEQTYNTITKQRQTKGTVNQPPTKKWLHQQRHTAQNNRNNSKIHRKITNRKQRLETTPSWKDYTNEEEKESPEVSNLMERIEELEKQNELLLSMTPEEYAEFKNA